MAKLWQGRSSGEIDKIADDFNASIHFDKKMFREDISGSVAHAAMLAKQGIITTDEGQTLIEALGGILEDLESGKLCIDPTCEDIHTFVEQTLIARIGDTGKKLHTARSRNDQVALDLRMYLRRKSGEIISLLCQLLDVLCRRAEETKADILPGYTHLQRAQPITFGHHLMAYAMMFRRDITRIGDALRRMNCCPIGSCALAGTTFDTDRFYEASALHFDSVCENSMDGVSDRDFCIELASAFATVMMHLSRFSEEIILWSSWEFQFVSLSDAYTTGSSIMPQKKNSDMAELVRGKAGRVYGDLLTLLTMLKGLPLAYNKDMQEDKEAIFDSVDTLEMCLKVFVPMIDTMQVRKDHMYQAAQKGFINATDLADYLTKKGMPFRTAYQLVGKLVAMCIQNNTVLEDLALETYRQASDLIDDDVYRAISLHTCVEKRNSFGGTSVSSVEQQIASTHAFLQNLAACAALATATEKENQTDDAGHACPSTSTVKDPAVMEITHHDGVTIALAAMKAAQQNGGVGAPVAQSSCPSSKGE